MTAAGLYAAMAAANTELTNPTKDKRATTGTYAYTYASLDTILGHVRPVLAKHGLSVLQDVVIEGDRVQIITKILHASGELLEFGPLGGPIGRDWQALGGGITYARRYALCAALGIAADEDDDAQHATASQPSTSSSSSSTSSTSTSTARGPLGRAQARESGAPATPRQVGMVRGLMKEHSVNEQILADFTRERLGFELPVDGLSHLTKHQASTIIEAMTSGTSGVTRTSERDEHDPWADAPIVDPASGEVAT